MESSMSHVTLPAGLIFPKTILEVSIEFDEHLKTGHRALYEPIPTGFDDLDLILDGGLHAESLMLVGGPPGVGKTILALQVARNIAASGDAVTCLVCFEHSEVYLYHRLVCLESIMDGKPDTEGITLEDIRRIVELDPQGGLQRMLDDLPPAREAWERIVTYWERLYLIKGHPVKTTLNVLDAFVTWLRSHHERVVLFVDYLQKVPVFTPGMELTPDRQIRSVTEGLKNLAMSHQIPVVAIAASDADGLKSERVRFEDLWGGASIKYEPDVALMLNLERGSSILFSVEKNRLGPIAVGIPYVLRGEYFAFQPRVRTCT